MSVMVVIAMIMAVAIRLPTRSIGTVLRLKRFVHGVSAVNRTVRFGSK